MRRIITPMDIPPLHLDELKKVRKPIPEININPREHLSKLDSLALWITEYVGTMGFFLVILIWTIFWLSWNMFAPHALRFDPYPGFVLWLFITNMLQMFLMPLIMIGQNLQGQHAEVRAEADFEISIKTAKEMEAVLQHLENQNKLILEMLHELKRIK
ncbi:MAG TPA: DUF1003 domain-containing protein [Nitrospiria bacterium]|nr:DUF1003 domain-containing protein [Nitrospiria bacterium]